MSTVIRLPILSDAGGIAAFGSVHNMNRSKCAIKHTSAPPLPSLLLHTKSEQQEGLPMSRLQAWVWEMQLPVLVLGAGAPACAYAAAGSAMKRARVERRMIVR